MRNLSIMSSPASLSLTDGQALDNSKGDIFRLSNSPRFHEDSSEARNDSSILPLNSKSIERNRSMPTLIFENTSESNRKNVFLARGRDNPAFHSYSGKTGRLPSSESSTPTEKWVSNSRGYSRITSDDCTPPRRNAPIKRKHKDLLPLSLLSVTEKKDNPQVKKRKLPSIQNLATFRNVHPYLSTPVTNIKFVEENKNQNVISKKKTKYATLPIDFFEDDAPSEQVWFTNNIRSDKQNLLLPGYIDSEFTLAARKDKKRLESKHVNAKYCHLLMPLKQDLEVDMGLLKRINLLKPRPVSMTWKSHP
uniref:Uncharacterized protein n=1 Tax=Corethron hystrix TaxID=216773 RepID=A0A7S1BR90_9STRA|mmetsp:Transcript_38125/g.88743  ORF Transcript_38125/g.88743 Transcript_38125/m.88743 type:complete len:306 (+) Transcript_38125:132-1049(+)